MSSKLSRKKLLIFGNYKKVNKIKEWERDWDGVWKRDRERDW